MNKDGEITSTPDPNLLWEAISQSQRNVTLLMASGSSKQLSFPNATKLASVQQNIAYGIVFSGGSVEFCHSAGSDLLALVASPVSVGTSSV